MLEIAAVVVTIGAVLYRSAHLSILAVGYVSLGVFVVVFLGLRSRRGITAGVLLGLLMLLGYLAMWRIDEPVEPRVYGDRAFDVRVLSVDRRLDKTNLLVRDSEYGETLQVTMMQKTGVLPGDMTTVRGRVEAPEDFTTDTGRVFPYQAYLESKGIVGVVRKAIVGPTLEHTFSIARFPTRIRFFIADTFSKYVSFPFDGILSGMLVGYQGGIPSSIQDLFRNTGVLHVLVLSGYNITLLAGFLAALFRSLPFRVRMGMTSASIILLVLVSGAGVASVRAGIMGSIAVFAGLSIRSYSPLRALTIAYLIFFFLRPTTIFVDPGFHLSFLATLFMVVVLPKIEPLFVWIPKTSRVDFRELIMLAITAPLFMLPYLMYFSGLIPLSSPIANIVFALVTPLIMMLGFVLIVLSWATPIATLLGVLLSSCGSLVLFILKWCSTLYIWNTPPLSGWSVCALYSVVLMVVFRRELMKFLRGYRSLLQYSSSGLQRSQ